MKVRKRPQVRCPPHLAWVRGFDCCVKTPDCNGNIEAAHVRNGTDAGLGVKPSDYWTIPLCGFHHGHQHTVGEARFEAHHKINMREIAGRLAKRSPHKGKWE